MVILFNYPYLSISMKKRFFAIDPKKDVDGFHPANFGRMALDLDAFIPATPFWYYAIIGTL